MSIQLGVRQAAARYGQRTALEFAGRTFSFTEVLDRSLRLAAALDRLGIAPGDRIGVMATNGPWFFELRFACAEGGFVEAPLNLRFTEDELVAYLGQIRPRALLVTPDQVPRAVAVAAGIDSIAHVIGVADGHGLDLDLDRLVAAEVPLERTLRDPEETVLISATSGTSGTAKAVQHSQRSTSAGWSGLIERVALDEQSRVVSALPMYFAPAYSGWTASFVAGARQIILPSFEPVGYVDAVEGSRGTHAFLGPAPVNLIMDSGADLARLRCLQMLSMGGGPAQPERLRTLTSALGTRVVIQFGMTELAVGTILLGDEIIADRGALTPEAASVGRPIPGLDIRIAEDAGDEVGPGSVGDIEVRGALTFSGYLGAEARDPGTWFATGDVGLVDEQGNLHIVDRRKDLIVSGGINIAPFEVERVITAMPGVRDAGVCAVPDDTYGEAVHAAIVLEPGETVSEADVVRWCRGHLASVKKPRSIAFVEELPYSSTGKLLRRTLREQATTRRGTDR